MNVKTKQQLPISYAPDFSDTTLDRASFERVDADVEIETMSSPKTFTVTLVPAKSMSDDQAVRSLRPFLKMALRCYGLRCTRAEQRDDEVKPNYQTNFKR